MKATDKPRDSPTHMATKKCKKQIDQTNNRAVAFMLKKRNAGLIDKPVRFRVCTLPIFCKKPLKLDIFPKKI